MDHLLDSKEKGKGKGKEPQYIPAKSRDKFQWTDMRMTVGSGGDGLSGWHTCDTGKA